MSDEIHVSNYGLPAPDPAAFSAIPQYYNPFPAHSPARPGWYCCELTGGRIKHLTWYCGSFWDDDQECPDVAYWVELPAFVQVILQKPPPVLL